MNKYSLSESRITQIWRFQMTYPRKIKCAVYGITSILMSATILCAQSNENWKPPQNVEEIIRFMAQEKVNDELTRKMRDVKNDLDKKILKLGKELYDTGITESKLEELVENVLKENGKKNPTVNYEKDLALVVDNAVNELLKDADLGAMRDYIKKDLLKKVTEAVAAKGMREVAHLVTANDLVDVYDKAYEKARLRFNDKIEQLKKDNLKIDDGNALWKEILNEEYEKATCKWILEELQKNWGQKLTDNDKEYKQIENEVRNRVEQLPRAEKELKDYIKSKINEIYEEAKNKKLTYTEREMLISKLYDEIRSVTGIHFDSLEKKDMKPDDSEQKEKIRKKRNQEVLKQIDEEIEKIDKREDDLKKAREEAKQSGNKEELEMIEKEQDKAESKREDLKRKSKIIKKITTPETYHCNFLITLFMKNRYEDKLLMQISLLKKNDDGSEKTSEIINKVVPLGINSIVSQENAADVIQEALEERNSFNLCVDKAMLCGMKENNLTTTPPVQLNCYLRYDERHLGNIWETAVNMGVSNTAKNGWTGADIRFTGVLKEKTE